MSNGNCGPLTVHEVYPLNEFEIGTAASWTFQDDYGDSHYYVGTEEAMTWEEGEKYC